MTFNPYGRPTSRDQPEQIDQLHLAGYRRSVELDGIGIWEHEAWPHDSWTGAAEALRHAHAHFPYRLAPPGGLNRALGRA